jgi:hypothetical protein
LPGPGTRPLCSTRRNPVTASSTPVASTRGRLSSAYRAAVAPSSPAVASARRNIFPLIAGGPPSGSGTEIFINQFTRKNRRNRYFPPFPSPNCPVIADSTFRSSTTSSTSIGARS